MGDVYWMAAILIIQTVLSVGICVVLSKKTESVLDEPKDSMNEQ